VSEPHENFYIAKEEGKNDLYYRSLEKLLEDLHEVLETIKAVPDSNKFLELSKDIIIRKVTNITNLTFHKESYYEIIIEDWEDKLMYQNTNKIKRTFKVSRPEII